MFESIMNVDESNHIRIVNLQKGKWKQDPGPTQATARMVKKQCRVGLHQRNNKFAHVSHFFVHLSLSLYVTATTQNFLNCFMFYIFVSVWMTQDKNFLFVSLNLVYMYSPRDFNERKACQRLANCTWWWLLKWCKFTS